MTMTMMTIGALATRYIGRSVPQRLLRLSKCVPLSQGLSTEASKAIGSTPISSKGLYDLLTKEEEELMEEQHVVTDRAKDISNRIGKGVKMRDTRFLEDILPGVPNFSIVVAGEFNAGKSSVINALLGQKLLDTGALPTTDAITVLTHSPDGKRSTANLKGGLLWHQVDAIPEGIVLVDTPGTNAVIVDHTSQTLKLLPTADLILFCTSADRPFPESERKLLQSIQAYRKNIIVIINKMDVLDSSGGSYGFEEKKRVVDFVTEHASAMLGGRPMVISISAKDALSCKLMVTSSTKKKEDGDENTLWNRSNFAILETFLKESLTTETKIKAKLLNPLGVAEGVLVEGLEILVEEEKDLESDVATLNLLNHQFESWTKEMEIDRNSFCTEIKDDLESEGVRVSELVKKIGILKLMRWSLLDDAQWDAAWSRSTTSQKTVEADLMERIREHADHTSRRAQSQGQAVIDYLGKRPSVKNKDIVGTVMAASQFEDTRKTLTDQMKLGIARVLGEHDDGFTKAHIQSTLQQHGAAVVGLETTAAASFVSGYLELLDIVYAGGLGCASAMLGVVVATKAGSSISETYSSEWSRLGGDLYAGLEIVCTKEMLKVNRRILDGVKPYSRYVQTEQERIQTLMTESEEAVSQAHAIRNRIDKLRHYE